VEEAVKQEIKSQEEVLVQASDVKPKTASLNEEKSTKSIISKQKTDSVKASSKGKSEPPPSPMTA
jgi:hypothetical protein